MLLKYRRDLNNRLDVRYSSPWKGVRYPDTVGIQNPTIQNPDHLGTNLLSSIQQLYMSGFRIPTVFLIFDSF